MRNGEAARSAGRPLSWWGPEISGTAACPAVVQRDQARCGDLHRCRGPAAFGAVVPVAWTPGTYHMDGEEALSHARVRRDSNDYYRMGRQRCVLEAIAAQTDPVTIMRRLPHLVPAVQGSVLTDIPVPDWPDFIELAATDPAGPRRTTM